MDNYIAVRADDYWVHLLDKFPVERPWQGPDSDVPFESITRPVAYVGNLGFQDYQIDKVWHKRLRDLVREINPAILWNVWNFQHRKCEPLVHSLQAA
jgi:hypothetical protein